MFTPIYSFSRHGIEILHNDKDIKDDLCLILDVQNEIRQKLK